MANTVMAFVSHSDDEVIGCGATLIKYKKEGKNIVVIIFSYGEKSHPHLKEEVVSEARQKETEEVDKILNRETIFLGFEEGKIKQEAKERNIKEQIRVLVKRYNPEKIFTHSSSDPHPDHKAVNEVVINILKAIKYKGSIYAFEVWNILNENTPAIYIDISETFNLKKRMLKKFKSQKFSIYPLWLPIWYRAKSYGKKCGCKYAEKFYKIQ
ncbi:PIG-L family deacetylase [Candidatus Woesearchaeota archaeon]|nr:PIG-L family deacetylase [Candidatus Woesearchaeota archaeon]